MTSQLKICCLLKTTAKKFWTKQKEEGKVMFSERMRRWGTFIWQEEWLTQKEYRLVIKLRECKWPLQICRWNIFIWLIPSILSDVCDVSRLWLHEWYRKLLQAQMGKNCLMLRADREIALREPTLSGWDMPHPHPQQAVWHGEVSVNTTYLLQHFQ